MDNQTAMLCKDCKRTFHEYYNGKCPECGSINLMNVAMK